jgi:DNA-binding protein HU-beta
MAKAALKRAVSAKPKTVAKAKTVAKTEASKSAKPAATITLRQIAAEIAEAHGFSKRQAEAVLTETVAHISKGITKGKRVRFGNLGIFSVKKRAARKGRNPATGEAIKIKASKKVAFRPAKELKDAL